ncbi:CPBP family intramembrane glutamic endopeptidase [Sphingomonas bacterium]|uniref:CPBP family intramembrane glutamic endopeptidase n=1 Tax=Sphingomonas bacterium TaxID=1895847 RepID=UPI0020C5DC67|nr:CPBP family intramembrane glutamic endopeptidase [Sphingomonas bacterium]
MTNTATDMEVGARDYPSAAPSPRGWFRYIFVGADGLRAGWSLLLFIVLVALLAAGVSFAMAFVAKTILHLPPPAKGAPGEAGVTFANDATGFLTFGVASLIMARIERRPFARYGLTRSLLLPDLLKGMAWGIAMLSLLVGMLVASGALAFDGIVLGGREAVGYALAWFAAFAMVGLFEEYLTRGYLQYTLARGVVGIVRAVAPHSRHARTIGFWIAALVFSVGVFAGGHLFNRGETAMGIVGVALAGITFVYVLYRTGSLWWAIGFHATWDWAQSYLYGVHDSGLAVTGHLLASHPVGAPLLSGGSTGPEGSVLLIPTLLLTMVIIHLTLPRRAAAFDPPGRALVPASVI